MLSDYGLHPNPIYEILAPIASSALLPVKRHIRQNTTPALLIEVLALSTKPPLKSIRRQQSVGSGKSHGMITRFPAPVRNGRINRQPPIEGVDGMLHR